MVERDLIQRSKDIIIPAGTRADIHVTHDFSHLSGIDRLHAIAMVGVPSGYVSIVDNASPPNTIGGYIPHITLQVDRMNVVEEVGLTEWIPQTSFLRPIMHPYVIDKKINVDQKVRWTFAWPSGLVGVTAALWHLQVHYYFQPDKRHGAVC